MQVPRSAYDGLTDAINDLSGKSRELFDARFRDGLSAFLDAGGAVPPENVAALREFAIGLLDDVGGAAAEVAYSYGAEFYDAARAAAVGSPLHASPAPPNPHAANEAAVKGMIETVAKTGQVEPFAAACAARVDYVARKSCGDAVVQCAAKDPRKPRFARVPQGGETCRFCIMLASRGAVYLTEHKAGAVNHYHANCDCKVVPDFGDGIEGYDPDEWHDKWKHPEKHPEIREARNARRRELRREQRSRKATKQARAVEWVDPEIEALRTSEEVSAWLESRDIEATRRFLGLPIEAQKGAIAGFRYASDRYGPCDVARFDSISDASIMGKYDPRTATIRISDQVDDPFLTGLHEAMHALDNLRSGTIEPLGYDAYSRSVVKLARRKLAASSDRKYRDLLLEFTGLKVIEADYYHDNPCELIPIAAEASYQGKHSKLGDALLEEVLKYDQV